MERIGSGVADAGAQKRSARIASCRNSMIHGRSTTSCHLRVAAARTPINVLMNIEQQFVDLHDFWSPRVIGRVNDQYVKVAKLKGEFTWHKHDDEDEMFLVVKGRLKIQFEDRDVELGPGDFHIVPKGVRHNPVADEECWIMLIETVTTKHTGDVVSPLTKTIEQQLER